MIHYEDFERERLEPIYDIVAPYSEMQKNERYFLNGMIRYFKPKKILEVGVANGGGTAIILNAISDIDGAELHSVDYTENSYRYPNKPSGFLVSEKFSNLASKWKIYRGGDISCFIEKIGSDIDMLVLDTVHTHPWETLNFLCVLPFMKKNFSWTILHDINIFVYPNERYELACRYLFSSVVSQEKITPAPDDMKFSNIGAFKISDETEKFSVNLFESLLTPWNIQVPEKDIAGIKNIIEKYYTSEQYKFFCDVIELQDYMFKNPRSIKSLIKGGIKQRANPKLFAYLQKIKRSLRIE